LGRSATKKKVDSKRPTAFPSRKFLDTLYGTVRPLHDSMFTDYRIVTDETLLGTGPRQARAKRFGGYFSLHLKIAREYYEFSRNLEVTSKFLGG